MSGGDSVKLLYIAGPYRGPTAWDIENNIRRVEEVGIEIARAGAFPVMVHANCRFFQGQGTDAFWLDGTMELMRRCDAIVLIPGWTVSVGSNNERNEAARLGMPIFNMDGFDSLYDWIRTLPDRDPKAEATPHGKI